MSRGYYFVERIVIFMSDSVETNEIIIPGSSDNKTNETNPFDPRFYFLLGNYMGKVSKIRALLEKDREVDDLFLMDRMQKMAYIGSDLGELENEIMKYLY